MPFTVATFNVLDRFNCDTIAASLAGPAPIDEERARLANEAAERLYAGKIRATANSVRRLDADVIAFQEVQGTSVLDDVRANLPERESIAFGGYLPAVAGPTDRRGIGCAVLSRFPIERIEHHTDANLPFPTLVAGDPPPFATRLTARRGVLEVVVRLPDTTLLHVLVVHFKSKISSALIGADGITVPMRTMRDVIEGQVRAEIVRIAEALHLRAVIDRRLDENPDVQLLVAGDLNDTPDSMTVRAVTGDEVSATRAAFDEALTGIASPLKARALHSLVGSGRLDRAQTIEWRGKRETIDHLFVSDAMWSRFRHVAIHNERLTEYTAALGPAVRDALESDHSPLIASFV